MVYYGEEYILYTPIYYKNNTMNVYYNEEYIYIYIV